MAVTLVMLGLAVRVGTAAQAGSQNPKTDAPQELRPGQQTEREMTGAQTHRYQLSLQKDEFLQVRVEQKGVDVTLKLLDSGGTVLATMDSPNDKQGPETLSLVASQAGGFVLEVSVLDAKAEKGTYSIKREDSRAATARDKRRVEVERLFVEGMTARSVEGQSETAIAKLEDALKGWRELEDSYLTDLTERQVKALRLQPKMRAFIAELNVPSNLITEGNKLLQEGKPESALAARAKFTEGIEAARKFFKRLDDESLSDILSKENRANLKARMRVSEVSALAGISNTYNLLKGWQESVDYDKQAIAVIHEILQDPEISASKELAAYAPLKVNEATMLVFIGTTLTTRLKRPQDALSYEEKALTLWREVQREYEKYRAYAEEREVYTLQAMGQSYLVLDDRDKALEYFEQALAIARRLPGQKTAEALVLLQTANIYSGRLDYEQARRLWDEALTVYEGLGEKPPQARVLHMIGLSFFNVGNEQKGREYFNRELAILLSDDYLKDVTKEMPSVPLPDYKGEPPNTSGFYKDMYEWERSLSIGNVYSFLGDYEKGREHYGKALTTARAMKDQGMIRLPLSFIGDTYSKQERWRESLDYYKQALEISRQLSRRSDQAVDLSDLAYTYIQMKRWPDALQNVTEALLIYQSLGADKSNLFTGYAITLNLMARAEDELGNRRLAIFYEKQSVNAIQRERQQLKNLDEQAQRGYLKRNEKPYRRLADWLIAEGRIIEAEQVLAMLKQEEVFDYLRRDASESDNLQQRADLKPEERDALKRYSEIADKITSLGAEFGALQELQSKGVKLTAEEESRYKELSGQIEDASRAFQVFLRQLADEFAKRTNTEKDLQENLALQADLKSWGEGIVFLYTLTSEDRYRVILVTPDTQVDGKTEIKATELNDKIEKFRAAVQNPSVDPRPLGKELYDILIKPVEKQLDGVKAKTLLWSLDGNLRLLPLAALWDGKQYLGQKYQSVTVTLASRTRLGDAVAPDWRALGLGVSEGGHVREPNGTREYIFKSLPAVIAELRAVVQSEQSPGGVLPGQSLLDADFNESAFESQLLRGYKVIHIASHFNLNPGDATMSFLLLGDGSILTVDELRNNPRLKFGGVELLTLSACDTAVVGKDGSGKEIEGFGYVAQQKGAKAILATLWSVADESTSLLMSEFYRLRKENPRLTKADALQMAQREMIEGRLSPSAASNGAGGRGSKLAGEAGSDNNQPKFSYDKSKPYAHPYFWSPFVLIGNWK
jgi:CHAT domain-containing protein